MGSIKLETTGKKHTSKSLDTLVPDINKLLVNLTYKKKVPVTEEQLSKFLNNISNVVLYLFKIPRGLDWTFFYELPFVIFLIPLIILSFFSKNMTVYFLLSFLLLIHLFLFLLNLEIVSRWFSISLLFSLKTYRMYLSL